MKIFRKRFWCVSAFLFFCAAPAHATRITNMDDIPYDLQVKEGGEEKAVALEPNETWESHAFPVHVFYNKRWNELDVDSSFAIWKGGVITRQKLGQAGRN